MRKEQKQVSRYRTTQGVFLPQDSNQVVAELVQAVLDLPPLQDLAGWEDGREYEWGSHEPDF